MQKSYLTLVVVGCALVAGLAGAQEQPGSGNASAPAGNSDSAIGPAGGVETPPGPSRTDASSTPTSADALEKYRAAEREARRLAQAHRTGGPRAKRAKTVELSPDGVQLQGEWIELDTGTGKVRVVGSMTEKIVADLLRAKVAEAFEARQQLLRAQLADFRKRLAAIEEAIDTRERLKEVITDQRVQELLRGDAPESTEPLDSGAAQHMDAVQAQSLVAELAPAANPSLAVVWIEAVFDGAEPNQSGQAKAVYLNGTVVSPHGVIAVVLGPEHDPTKRLKSVKVYLDDLRIVDGRLAIYNTTSGVGLIKVDAAGLPFLELSRDPIAANRRLRLLAMRVSANKQKDRWESEVRVEQTDYQHNEAGGFFTISRPAGRPNMEEDAGAALVSATTGRLEGIVGLITPDPYQDQPVAFAPDPPVWAVGSNVIESLLRDLEKTLPGAEGRGFGNEGGTRKGSR